MPLLVLELLLYFMPVVIVAFFATPQYNKILCHLLSADVLTPANYWKNNHLKHHSILGNTEVFDIANTIPYSKKQFQELPASKKFIFRIVREPIVFFTIFPLIQWWFEYPLKEGNPFLWAGHISKLIMMYYLSPYIFFCFLFCYYYWIVFISFATWSK